MAGYVVTSKVDGLIYVILSKAKKDVPYGELVGITEGVTQTEVITSEFSST